MTKYQLLCKDSQILRAFSQNQLFTNLLWHPQWNCHISQERNMRFKNVCTKIELKEQPFRKKQKVNFGLLRQLVPFDVWRVGSHMGLKLHTQLHEYCILFNMFQDIALILFYYVIVNLLHIPYFFEKPSTCMACVNRNLMSVDYVFIYLFSGVSKEKSLMITGVLKHV